MLIRCERCSTLYELDEGLLSAMGSQVQCTKCQNVFTASPPGSPGETLPGFPAATAPNEAEPAFGTASRGLPQVAQPVTAPAPAEVKNAPKPARSGQPAVYRPGPARQSSVHRAPVLKRDTVGAFEARLRLSARLRWIVPSTAAVVVAAVAAALFLLSRRVDADVLRARDVGVALIALDDLASLEKAEGMLDGVALREARLWSAAADAAMARALHAGAVVEQAAPLAARLAAKIAERDRLALEAAPGTEEAVRAAAEDAKALETQLEPGQRRARELSGDAFARLQELSSRRGNDAAVQRAFAVYFALAGDREQAERAERAARERGGDDAWLMLAEAILDARETGRPARERVLAQVGSLAASRPDLLRARFILARAQAALGRRQEAAATLDGLLAANPGHERARQLRAELLASPAVTAASAGAARPASPTALQAVRPGPLPRKNVALPVEPPAPLPAAMQPIPIAPPPGPPPVGASGGAPSSKPAMAPPTAAPSSGGPSRLATPQ